MRPQEEQHKPRQGDKVSSIACPAGQPSTAAAGRERRKGGKPKKENPCRCRGMSVTWRRRRDSGRLYLKGTRAALIRNAYSDAYKLPSLNFQELITSSSYPLLEFSNDVEFLRILRNDLFMKLFITDPIALTLPLQLGNVPVDLHQLGLGGALGINPPPLPPAR